MGYPKPVTVTGVTYAKFGPRGKGLGGWGIDSQKPTPGARFDVDDLALAFVRFENGATLQLQAAWATNLPDEQVVEILGTEGGARIPSPDQLSLYADLNDVPVDIVQPVRKDTMWSSAKQSADLIRYLDGDASADVVTGEQILVGMSILDAVYRSAQSGREVVLA
jgi:predicted dehydrogenase